MSFLFLLSPEILLKNYWVCAGILVTIVVSTQHIVASRPGLVYRTVVIWAVSIQRLKGANHRIIAALVSPLVQLSAHSMCPILPLTSRCFPSCLRITRQSARQEGGKPTNRMGGTAAPVTTKDSAPATAKPSAAASMGRGLRTSAGIQKTRRLGLAGASRITAQTARASLITSFTEEVQIEIGFPTSPYS